MPANNIVTDKYGLAKLNSISGIYKLASLEETQVSASVVPTGDISTYFGYITEENLLQNNVPTGISFYYTLYSGDYYENGFGKIIESGGQTVLLRETPISFYNGFSSKTTTLLFDFGDGEFLLQASAPITMDVSLAFENSVLCSSSSGVSNPVPLQNNTLLGCKNNSVQSIDGPELVEMFGDNIPNAINGKSLSLTSVVLSSIRLLPSQRTLNPPRGTIIYNDNDNNLEFYDGNSWRTL